MIRGLRLAVSVVGAGALAGSVLTGAFAAVPRPFNTQERAHAKKYSVNGDLTVTSVLKVNKNLSIYGNTYSHGREEVWKGLVVRAGGIKSDALTVTGPIQAQSAVIATNLQAGAITGTTLALTGAATVGGALSANGKIAGNGVDAGAGGLTTTGASTLGALSASSVADSGALSAGSITTSGTLNAGATTLSGLTVSGAVNLANANITGNVNFSNANVTGLNLSSFLQNGATLPTLTVGSSAATSSPLTVAANGKTASLNVSSTGALTTSGDLAVGGALSVAGAFAPGSLTTSTVVAPNASGTSTLGSLTLQGNGISLAGNTTIANGADLAFSTASNSAGHVLATGDVDLAGTVQISAFTGQTPSQGVTVTRSFTEPFATQPAVVVTPMSDPGPNLIGPPKIWVTLNQNSSNQYTGFTLHYAPSQTVGASYNVLYAYHVIGS